MSSRPSILLKLSGEIFLNEKKEPSIDLANHVAAQIKELQKDFYISVVIGGGNFFRGSKDSERLKLSQVYGHYVGMLATQMNSLILKDCFDKNNIESKVLSALPSPAIATTLSQNNIIESIKKDVTIIFAGGNGTPYFSTDTTSVIRALQTNAKEIWKATNVDGVFDKDPNKYPDAILLKEVSFKDAIEKELKIMDTSAFALAQENDIKIKVFNVFKENSILNVSKNITGTTVYKG